MEIGSKISTAGGDGFRIRSKTRSFVNSNESWSIVSQSQPCHEWEGTPRMTQERVYIGCDGCKSCNPGRSEPRQSVLYPINPLNARIYPWPSSRLRWTWTRYRLEINSTVNPTSGGYVENLLRPCLSAGSTRPPLLLLFLCFAPGFLTVRDWRIFRFLRGFIRH